MKKYLKQAAMKTLILLPLLLLFTVTARTQDNITLNMFNANHGRTFFVSQIYVDSHNNFQGASFVPVQETDSAVAVPATGWTNQIAAEPGTQFIAYLKGIYYQIYVEDYLVRSNEQETTTGDWFSYTKTVSRSTETLGVRINYRQLINVKIESSASENSRSQRIFLGYSDNSIFITKIKTMLTKNGCVITANPPQSSLHLNVSATSRQVNSDRDFVYCYLDVILEVFDTSTGESVYADDFSQKGISTSRDRAVRAAVDDAVEAVSEKIKPLILKNKEQ